MKQFVLQTSTFHFIFLVMGMCQQEYLTKRDKDDLCLCNGVRKQMSNSRELKAIEVEKCLLEQSHTTLQSDMVLLKQELEDKIKNVSSCSLRIHFTCSYFH